MPSGASAPARRGPALTRPLRPALILYLITIVVPTLALLFLGIQAVARQREAIAGLSVTNARLQEARVADLAAQGILDEAQACLQDEALRRALTIDHDTPERLHDLRVQLDAVAARHPIARFLFVMEGGRLRVPRSDVSFPGPIEIHLAREPPLVRARLATLFAEGETMEHAGRAREALASYRRAHDAAATGRARALALSRIARCEERLRERQAALITYRTIVERFGDDYDPTGRPHALVAGVELARLARVQAGAEAITPLLFTLRRDVVEGRWEVTADEADYFLERLETGRLGGGAPPDPTPVSSPFLESLRAARLIRDDFQARPVLAPGQVYQASLSDGGLQMFYAQASPAPMLVGLVVDLAYVGTTILPGAATSLGVSAPARLVSSEAGGTPLRSALPSFGVVLDQGVPAASPSGVSDVVVFGGAMFLVLSVLLIGVALIVRDVARETATSQLRADLVGGVSHELKTPLAVIRMYGETLANDPDAPPEERRWFYGVIVQESARLARLIQGVLDFSRAERGERTYAMAPGSLPTVVRDVAERYRPYLLQQQFALEVAPGGDDLPLVNMDDEAVSEALLNLIDNAVKYAGEDRSVSLRVSRVDDGLAVTVEDHGEGIPPADQQQIFTRFYRGRGRSGRGGYGLGLYLVKHMMDAHHGRIDLDSEPRRGSRFTLVFPVAQATEPKEGDGAQDPDR